MDTQIEISLAVTEGEATRRATLQLGGSRGEMTVDDETTEFAVGELWPTVRGFLPEAHPLVAAPAPDRVLEGPLPGDLASRARAMVVVGTSVQVPGGAGPGGVVRTWLATDDALYAVEPGMVRQITPGAVAQTLVWDVTGAMQQLVRGLEAAS